MPSRLAVLGIVLFWIGSMCWLVARELAPSWRVGEPPTIVFDLADEIGANTIVWSIHHHRVNQKSKIIGFGNTRVKRLANQWFELTSELKFSEKLPENRDEKLPDTEEDKEEKTLFKALQFKKMLTTYWVNKEGQLQGMEIQANFLDLDLKVRGEVRDDLLTPTFLFNDQPIDLIGLKPIRLDRHGRLLNPMHLVNKVAGLYPGQTWSIPLLDPSEAIAESSPFRALIQSSAPRLKSLLAEVTLAELSYQGAPVPCFRIDYAPPGEKTVATTWVRRRDGLVLQQEAELLMQKIHLRRETRQN